MTLHIKTLPVGQLQTNCYLIIDPKSHDTLIVDPGDAADYIINMLRDIEGRPTHIIATHGHFDHILAVTELQLAYQIPFLIHQKDVFLVSRMQESAQHFLGITVDPPPHIDGYVGKTIRMGKETISIIETPGHTPGSVCLYMKKEYTLLSGDTLFSNGGVGRTDFSYSNPDALQKSLQKLFKLPQKTIVNPGHGSATTIAQEAAIHAR